MQLQINAVWQHGVDKNSVAFSPQANMVWTCMPNCFITQFLYEHQDKSSVHKI
jgi:hypothetical protein